MVSSHGLLSFICFLVILIISQSTAKPDDEAFPFCITSSKDSSPNSTYRTNLNTVLSRLTSSPQNDYGFYNSSYGQDSDKVYATGLCRGDVTPDTCRSCLNNSSSILLKNCSHHTEAMAMNDECTLHYANRLIFGYDDTDDLIYEWSSTNVTDWDRYSYVLKNFLSRLGQKAANSDSQDPNRKFAAGHVTSPSVETIYAAVQCNPDLTVAQCSDCLVAAFSKLPTYCSNRSGCGVTKFSCNFRYGKARFYAATVDDAITISLAPQGSPVPSPLPSPLTPSINTEPSKSTNQGKSNRSLPVIAKVVPAVAFVVLLIFVCIYLRVRKSRKHFESEDVGEDEVYQVKLSQFDFDTIRVATNNFSDANELGQGGFGPVYKGKLSNEQEIAVKRLSRNSCQGDTEFKNEVVLMAKLQHRNLVRLLGFCFQMKERLLVYEFLPHKSLDYFLFDPIRRTLLDWKTRYMIIEGIARGLLYLHEDSQQKIIHRDLKPSNILLDANMNPKISDFGLAKLFDSNQTQAIASKIAGTLGYMAPEYARRGKFSMKSDLFSFGVIILEIVSGQKSSAFHDGENVEHLLSFAWKNWRERTTSNIIDPILDSDSKSEIERCIHIGLLCVQEKVADRPTLASVLLMLNSQSFCISVPMQPAFFIPDKCTTTIQFSECGSMSTESREQKCNSAEASTNDASISSLYPR